MAESTAKRRAEPDDRRRGTDLWERLLGYLALIGWAVLIAAFFVYGRARPQTETFFERYYQLPVRTVWDMAWVRPLVWLLVAGLLLGLFGVFVNGCHSRRRTDRWRASLIWLAVFCLLGLLALLGLL